MQIVIVTALACAGVLIGAGVWREIAGRRAFPVPDADARFPHESRSDPAIRPQAAIPGLRGSSLFARLRRAAARHPVPLLGVIESAVWIAVLAALIQEVRSPREGAVAFAVWALTIGPHEMGHVICMPFGWFLHVAGGSIWQVLLYALLALWSGWVRRQPTVALLLWALVGLSFVNLAPYIGDARARSLPLLFGMSSDHHDWWNLLRRYGLLDYDHLFAAIATALGVLITTLAVGFGLLTTWLLPRTRLGPAPRYVGGYWRALRDALSVPAAEDDLPPEADFFA